MIPSIETARLRLYPACIDDLEARLAMDRDPRVMRHIRPIPEDLEAHRAEVRHKMLAVGAAEGDCWHVEDKAAPGFIGYCGLFQLEDSGLIEIGYRFVPAVWGRGVASEAAAAVLDHGFREMRLDPIVAVTDPDNLASQGVLGKIGLRPAGTAFHYGEDLLFYRLARAEYLASR